MTKYRVTESAFLEVVIDFDEFFDSLSEDWDFEIGETEEDLIRRYIQEYGFSSFDDTECVESYRDGDIDLEIEEV